MKGIFMKRTRFSVLCLGVFALALSLCFTACPTSAGSQEDITLTDWTGTWNSVTSYFDEPDLADMFAAGAGAAGQSIEDFKAASDAKRHTDFASCRILGSSITFYTGQNAEGDGETVNYSYKGEIPVAGYDGMVWHSYEGDTTGKYKYLLLLLPGNDEGEAPLHVHFLYGSSGFAALSGAGFDWFPQLIGKNEHIALIAGEVAGLVEGAIEAAANPDVTSLVIAEANNHAGLAFLATRDIPFNAALIQTARFNGFEWATSLANPATSTSAVVTGKSNQIVAPGSGFTFTINTAAAPWGLRAAIGFGSMFYFTAEANNLGPTTYNALLAALETLPEMGQGWVAPPPTLLTNLGIKIYDSTGDITENVSIGINLAEKADGKILIYYGAVMVDSAGSRKGMPLLVSDEEELIWDDGTANNAITAEWWITK